MTEDIDTYSNILQAEGYKLTTQRRRLLEVIIRKREMHLSVEEIFDELKKLNFHIGLATVYRTIRLFEKTGLVSHLTTCNGDLKYQLIDPEEKQEHQHLICEDCGNVIDIPNTIDIPKSLLEHFERKVFYENGFIITNPKVEFYGICTKCSEAYKINCQRSLL